MTSWMSAWFFVVLRAFTILLMGASALEREGTGMAWGALLDRHDVDMGPQSSKEGKAKVKQGVKQAGRDDGRRRRADMDKRGRKVLVLIHRLGSGRDEQVEVFLDLKPGAGVVEEGRLGEGGEQPVVPQDLAYKSVSRHEAADEALALVPVRRDGDLRGESWRRRGTRECPGGGRGRPW
ncbi:hypothetical protein C8J57DRAFT_1231037 [Mycena rebaudengoi]|nr:hypothetical protein C8J57DRAFT_1231037 [Mycena rebaudengoi]